MKTFVFAFIFISAMQEIAMAEISSSTSYQGYLDQINNQRHFIKKELQIARSQKDIIKVNCLNDKLNQVDFLIKSINNSNILSIKDRALKLTSESNQCLGLFNNKPIVADKVQMFVDPSLPVEENTEVFNSFITSPPICVSCTK